MTTTAAEKVAGHSGEKKDEKVEKRRALGRGLASLLPGPRVVAPSPESRVPSSESGAAPQGLKPGSSSALNGTAEAVPFPIAATSGSSGGAGETEVPRFARNDKSVGGNDRSVDGNDKSVGGNDRSVGGNDRSVDGNERGDLAEAAGEAQASQELSADAAFAAGRANAPVPTFAVSSSPVPTLAVPALPVPRFEEQTNEVISIQAVADDRIIGNRVVFLPIEAIDKNPYQTRYVFDEDMLIELRDSIKEHGVVQPIVVRPAEEEGRYTLVLGERRLRASKMAEKETIPALVRRLSPQQAAEMTVLENIVREDLNPMEQAEAFRVLSLQFHLTQAEIADRIGLSRETVSNYMRLLRLPRKVMDYMLEGRLSFSDAREILRLEDDQYIEAVAEEVVAHQLKWDQIEDRVMRINGSFPLLPGQTLPGEKKKKGGGARWMDPNVRAAQTDMERTLGMRVRIRDRQGKGKIVIEYASVDDYERVTGLLRSRK
jgi:ParB family chromosome partitioning protein